MLPRAPSANCDRVGRCRPPIWRVFDLPLPIDPRTMVNHLRLRRRCRAGGGSSPVGKGARAARALVERAAASPSGERLGLLPNRCAASPALAVRGGARGRRLRLTRPRSTARHQQLLLSRALRLLRQPRSPHGAGAHHAAAYKLVTRDGVADASSLRQRYHRLGLTGNQYRVNRKSTGRFVGSATC